MFPSCEICWSNKPNSQGQRLISSLTDLSSRKVAPFQPFCLTEEKKMFKTRVELTGDSGSRIKISRAIYDERLLAYRYGLEKPTSPEVEITRSPFPALCRKCSPLNCSVKSLLSWLYSVFPILEWLPKYNIKESLVSDATGGMTVGIMHVPQGEYFFGNKALTDLFILKNLNAQFEIRNY